MSLLLQLKLIVKLSKMSRSLIILGGRAGVKIAREYANDNFDHFYGYKNFIKDLSSLGIKKIKSFEEFSEVVAYENTEYFIATGDNMIRQKFTLKILEQVKKVPYTIIHRTAELIGSFNIGPGTLICANTTLNLCSSIGSGCIVNTNSVIEHDCILQDFSQVSPGAIMTGYSELGNCSFLGAGSVINPNLTVGSNVLIGSQSVVTRNIRDFAKVKGIPANEY